MNRYELEHIIRASGTVAEVKELIVIGSQSILGQYPDISEQIVETNKSVKITPINPGVLYMSREADIIVPGNPEKSDLIDAILGELSQFHDTFGYYAQGVDFTTATLPTNWQRRLISICNKNTNGITGLCLEVHDMLVSKLVANREKDNKYVKAAINNKLVKKEILLDRIDQTDIDDVIKENIRTKVIGIFNNE
ncbi:hypothetical protein MHK_007854 [Candidatus Magnetomorum sp. HK-1]|nr:hypothetical protein MHK_007854 [Candidatus Magnetomorum sp. HK-1]